VIGQAWQTLRVALEDLGSALRDFAPWRPRAERRAPTTPGTANRPVGTCSDCGGTVFYSPVARLACCADGCTVITRAELEGGALEC
jgi:hypothetical protein